MNAKEQALLLELDAWDDATPAERLATARAAAESLPEPFAFETLQSHTLGGRSQEIAFFEGFGAKFALLPGQSRAILGYDRQNPYQPNAAQLEDWKVVQREYNISIEDYLNTYLSPLRESAIAPLLVETTSTELGYSASGDDQSESYQSILSELSAGFRLPTSDEWEYACAGGVRSLFRWGNDCPISNSYDDKQFDLHRRPNAFGLKLNSSTYQIEICQGPKFRGGDGGGSVCGGIGKVITWFPFATSFHMSEEEIDGWWIDNVFVRRVWPISI